MFIFVLRFLEKSPERLSPPSPHGNVEAALLDFVFDIAAAFLAQVAQDLAQHPLQRVILHLPTLRTIGRRDGGVAIITDVKRGGEAMTALLAGVSIMLHEASHILLGA